MLCESSSASVTWYKVNDMNRTTEKVKTSVGASAREKAEGRLDNRGEGADVTMVTCKDKAHIMREQADRTGQS